MITKTFEKDKRKIKKLVDGQNFDFLIMSLICMDAVVLGLMTSSVLVAYMGLELFILDRLFMAIFIIEMLMKLYANGPKFFKSGWNVFDFTIILISSFSFFSYFIIFRTFRLFRLLKYVDRFSHLRQIVNTFIMLIPNFFAIFSVLAVVFYVFAVMGSWLYGAAFDRFEDVGASLLTLLQVFTLDGWVTTVLLPMMEIYPFAWIYFVSFVFLSLLVTVTFLMNIISEIIEVASNKKVKIKSRL